MSYADELRARRARPAPARPAGPPRRRRPRPDLVLALAVILGPLLAIAPWLLSRQRVGDLEDRLVREANATFTAPRLRPTHAPPRPGTFGDAVARHLPAVQAEANALKDGEDDRRRARAVVAGERPVGELPARYREALDRVRPALDGLLEGTHAERADLHPDPLVPAPGTDWMGYQLAALLAGVEVREALAAGDPRRATARCLDGLGLARDASIGAMLVGRMVGTAVVMRLTPPCADALAALPPADRGQAVAAVRAVAGAIPPFDRTMREDFLSMELRSFVPVMDPSARARLAPAALVHVRAGEAPREVPRWERLLVRDGWRASRALVDDEVRAFGLAAGAREAALQAALDTARRDLNPVAYIAAPDFSRYARRADAAALRLDALLLVAAAADRRDATGAWPRTVEALAATGALDRAAATRLAPATALDVRDGTLVVTVTLPRGGDDEPATLVLRVSRQAR